MEHLQNIDNNIFRFQNELKKSRNDVQALREKIDGLESTLNGLRQNKDRFYLSSLNTSLEDLNITFDDSFSSIKKFSSANFLSKLRYGSTYDHHSQLLIYKINNFQKECNTSISQSSKTQSIEQPGVKQEKKTSIAETNNKHGPTTDVNSEQKNMVENIDNFNYTIINRNQLNLGPLINRTAECEFYQGEFLKKQVVIKKVNAVQKEEKKKIILSRWY